MALVTEARVLINPKSTYARYTRFTKDVPRQDETETEIFRKMLVSKPRTIRIHFSHYFKFE